MTPSVGSDNYLNVVGYDADLYNSTGTTLTSDLYGVGGNLVLGTVDFVQVSAACAFQSSFQARTVLKSGTTTSGGTPRTGTANPTALPTKLYTTDPDTMSAWTADGVNALQAGVEAI
jgi:hypothetical protein